MALDPQRETRARDWMADDPDPSTREALARLLDRAGAGDEQAVAEIQDAFSGPLEFGTAGLRGAMGPGESRMNLAVVSRAARGIADHLLEQLPEARGEDAPLVVIGYDARYNSRDFAERSAAIITAAGCRALLLDRFGPTPLIAFAVRSLHADAGIVVTASHNPPADNGYKVYLGGRLEEDSGRGVQIVPPADGRIAEHIADVGPVRDIPVAPNGWGVLGDDLREKYLEAITALPLPGAPRDVRIVHTALHGVGTELALAALHGVGFTDVHPVAKQSEPDPDFPTVSFPNPEEAGAIDLALELARVVEADVVIANDPDADRCAAAARDPHRDAWRMLTGDELGVLLGVHLARHHSYTGTFANSIVSSRWLGKVVTALGQQGARTLTGFKWISRAPGIVFGYEEAIGYCLLPDAVRDKDGLSTALIVAEMAAMSKAAGRSLIDELDDLAREHDLHATAQLSIRVEDLTRISAMMQQLRSNPPRELAGSPVTSSTDLAQGSVETTGLPPTEGVVLVTADDSRVIVRPSGTEPKLKCYLEVVEKVERTASTADLGLHRERAGEQLEKVRADMEAALSLPE